MFTTTIRTNLDRMMSGRFDTLAEARAYCLRWTNARARRYDEFGVAAVVRDGAGKIVGRYGIRPAR